MISIKIADFLIKAGSENYALYSMNNKKIQYECHVVCVESAFCYYEYNFEMNRFRCSKGTFITRKRSKGNSNLRHSTCCSDVGETQPFAAKKKL